MNNCNEFLNILLFILGSILCGVSTSGFLFLPPKFAAVWFGEEERATAISIAVASDSLGLALGYILPPLIVESKRNMKQVGNEIGTLLFITAVQSLATLIFVCISVKDAPPTPPSYSEWLKRIYFRRNDSSAVLHSTEMTEITPNHDKSDYKTLLRNLHFVLILILNSMTFGIVTVFFITLNEILIPKFPGYEKKIGLMMALGFVGSILSNIFIGKLLDQTHAFKWITVATTGFSCLLSAAFSLSFHYGTSFYSLFVIYILLVGVFTTYSTVSFEHVVELTYPISEATSGVLLICAEELCVLFFGESASLILHYIGAEMLLFCTTGLFILMFVISLFLKNKGPRSSLNSVEYDYIEKPNDNYL